MRKLFSVLLAAVMLFCMTGPAFAAGDSEGVQTVTSSTQLYEALEKASNGETILFYGEITITDLGYADKQVILKRGDPNSRIVSDPNQSVSIQNIIFDGDGIMTGYPLLIVQNDFNIEKCIFQNAGESYAEMSSEGGAVQVKSGTGSFLQCDFEHNYALLGAHIAIDSNTDVNIIRCTMKYGCGGHGGAIFIAETSTCNIVSSTITENRAMDYGGGITNGSMLTVKSTKIYNNSAKNGGADIGNMIGASINLLDSLEELNSLFSADRIVVNGWVCDYDFDKNTFIPDVDPTAENALLKLDYEYKEDEPEQPGEPEQSEQAQEPQEEEQPPAETPPPDDTTNEQDKSTVDEPPAETDDTSTVDEPPTETDDTSTVDEPPAETQGTQDSDELPTKTEDKENDDGPSIVYVPVYIPSRPHNSTSTTTTTAAETETKNTTVADASAPVFACGNAVIDVSRSVVLEGYSDGLLHLEDSLTRAQMATIIYRLLDADTLARYDRATSNFTDVSPTAWYSRYVSTIANAGIVSGVGNGCYNPDGKLTWAHILTVLSRFVEPTTYALQNIQYSGWALQSVQTAVALGWIGDYANFNPDAVITRGEFQQLVNGVLSLYQTV